MSDELTASGSGLGHRFMDWVKDGSKGSHPDQWLASAGDASLANSDPSIDVLLLASGSPLVDGQLIDFVQLTPVSLASLDDESRAGLMARRLASAPLNLTPILTLLLAACGRHVEDAALTRPPATDSATSVPPAAPELIPVRGDDETPGLTPGLYVSTVGSVSRADPSGLSPEAQDNILRRCLQAITDNELQPSAIHELCGLIDLDTVDRSHDVLWRWAPPIRSAPDPLTREAQDPSTQVCHLRDAQDLLFWMFRSVPGPATGYAGRVLPPAETAGEETIDASLVAAVPQAAAAAAGSGGFGGGLAALPVLALGGGSGGGGGGGTPAAVPAAAQPPVSEGQIAATPAEMPVPEPKPPSELTPDPRPQPGPQPGSQPELQPELQPVAEIVDDALTLLRHVDFGTGSGMATVRENASTSLVLYRIVLPEPDLEGNGVYLYLTGRHAALFQLNAKGELRLRLPADHETLSRYEVTINGREVARDTGEAVVTFGSQRDAPAKAGPGVVDAAHNVIVTVQDINDTPPDFAAARVTPGLTEDVSLGSAGSQGDGTIIYQARATPDVAGEQVVYSLTQGGSRHLVDIDSQSGGVWFVVRPSEGRHSFTVIATVGSQQARQTVTVTVAEGAPEPFGQGDDPQPGTEITLVVVGATPVKGARIFIDENNNGILDAGERTPAKLKGTTGPDGRVTLTIDQQGARYIADVSHLPGHQGMGWAIYYGQFGDAPLPQGLHVISPLTNLLALNTANRRAEWQADPNLDETSLAFEDQIITDNRNILINYFRRVDPTLSMEDLERKDVLHILDPATYGIEAAASARAEIEALIKKIATQAAMIANGQLVTVAHVTQATTALLSEMRAAPPTEPSHFPEDVRPVLIPIPGDPPEGQREPTLKRLVPTDLDPQDTTRNLGLDVRSRSGEDQSVKTLRPQSEMENDRPLPRPDAVPVPPTRLITDRTDPLDVFLGTASYFITGKYGYLQVQWDAFHHGAGDGPGAWVFAYFTPAHQGYDLARLTLAARDAFTQLAQDQRGADIFTFTVTDIEGNQREIVQAFTAVGVNDAPIAVPDGLQMDERQDAADVGLTLTKAEFAFRDVDDDPDNSGDSFAVLRITGIDGRAGPAGWQGAWGELRWDGTAHDFADPLVIGKADLNDLAAKLQVLPALHFHGTVTLTYVVVDDHDAQSNPLQLTISVNDVASAPAPPGFEDGPPPPDNVVPPGPEGQPGGQPPPAVPGSDTPQENRLFPRDPDHPNDKESPGITVVAKRPGGDRTVVVKVPDAVPVDGEPTHIIGDYGVLRIWWDNNLADPVPGRPAGGWRSEYLFATNANRPADIDANNAEWMAAARNYLGLRQFDRSKGNDHEDNAGAIGRDEFEYVVSDGTGTAPQSVFKTFIAYGVNDAPAAPDRKEVALDEGGRHVLRLADISWEDPDIGDEQLTSMTFLTIGHGIIEVTPATGGNPRTHQGALGQNGLTVSRADIESGRVLIRQADAESGTSVEITYRVTDQQGAQSAGVQTLILMINAQPDAPITRPQAPAAANEDVVTPLTATHFIDTVNFDADPGETLRAIVITGVRHGVLLFDGTPVSAHDLANGGRIFAAAELARLSVRGNGDNSDNADFNGAPLAVQISYYAVSSSYTGDLTKPDTISPHGDIPAGDTAKHTSTEATLMVPVMDIYDMRPRFDPAGDRDGTPLNPQWDQDSPHILIEGQHAGQTLLAVSAQAENIGGARAVVQYRLQGPDYGFLSQVIGDEIRIVSAPDVHDIWEWLRQNPQLQGHVTELEGAAALRLKLTIVARVDGASLTIPEVSDEATRNSNRRVSKDFFLRIENRDNHPPEFIPAPADALPVVGLTEIGASQAPNVGATWFEASLDEVDKADKVTRPAFRVHVADRDNVGGGTTETLTVAKNDAAPGRHHNHLVDITPDGTITFKTGKFNYERRDIELPADKPFLETYLNASGETVERRYFLIEVKVTSLSTLPGAPDGGRAATKQLRIYVGNIDDNRPVFNTETVEVEGIGYFRDGGEFLTAFTMEKRPGDTSPSLFQAHAIDPDGDRVTYRLWTPDEAARTDADGKAYLTSNHQQLVNHNHLIDLTGGVDPAAALAQFTNNGLIRLVPDALDHEHEDAFLMTTGPNAGRRYLEFHLEAVSQFPGASQSKTGFQKFRIYLGNLDDNGPEITDGTPGAVPGRRNPAIEVTVPPGNDPPSGCYRCEWNAW